MAFALDEAWIYNGQLLVAEKGVNPKALGEGDKIEFVARQEFNVEAHNKIDINSQNINIDARARMRVRANQFLSVDAPCGIEILSGIIKGVSCATKEFNSYLSLGG